MELLPVNLHLVSKETRRICQSYKGTSLLWMRGFEECICPYDVLDAGGGGGNSPYTSPSNTKYI